MGVGLIALNFADEDIGVLPGGHSIWYFLLGLLIAISAFWWFSAFDPG